MTLPIALVIGPMKAGTTWVHEYLAWRGDVCLPLDVKETFFFDRNWEKGTSWYASHFRDCNKNSQPLIVEVAPSLFHDPDAPGRVRDTLGEVPLLVTTRDPVKRAWSHYLHLRRKGYTRANLKMALDCFPEIIEASRYEEQIARWRACMPGAPITVLQLEKLVADRDAYTEQLCAALGLVYRRPPAELGQSNAGGVPPSYLLAKFGRHSASALRAAGGYTAVNAAKRLGLKRIFFGSDGARKNTPSEEELLFLHANLRR